MATMNLNDFTKVWNNAELLTAYIYEKNADKIASGQGWSMQGYSSFLRSCHQLARLLGEDKDTVVNHILAEARR